MSDGMRYTVILMTAVVGFAVVTPMEGRDMRDFKKPTQEELKKKLTKLQYEVTQEEGTERPFQNEYWNEHRAGIYVDVVSGEPLFSSVDKFDSKTGWPSFTRPLVKDNIAEKTDRAFFMVRTEVRSRHASSHLGHVFDDGPAPTGLRYCINSAALRFIPREDLAKEGYAEYEGQFGAAPEKSKAARAVFAGGCFWCMQPPFDALKDRGVLLTQVGYTGGRAANPTYEDVCEGGTGHVEAIEVVYDPTKIKYADLLSVFWRNVDPLDERGQFCDKGDQYTSAVYYLDDEQKKQAEQSLESVRSRLKEKGRIVTPIRAAVPFYPAEEYHQDYYLKNPLRYKYYRFGCGRDARLRAVWE